MIPILAAVLPSVITLADKLFASDNGENKKDFVMSILSHLYDKYMVKVIPDLPGIDEKKIVLEIMSYAIDSLVEKMKKSSNEQ